MKQEEQGIELRIRLNPKGDVEVWGPMNDPVVFLGMLETAKINLQRYMEKKGKPDLIELPKVGV